MTDKWENVFFYLSLLQVEDFYIRSYMKPFYVYETFSRRFTAVNMFSLF